MKLIPGSTGFKLRQDKVLDELEMSVEAAGYAPGSPAFDVALRAAKVEKCKEVKGFLTCAQCPAIMDCALRLASLRDGAK